MGDWPSVLLPPFKTVSVFHPESVCEETAATFISYASATVIQNQAYYWPFRLDVGATAVKMACHNGATAAGNTDVGIYDSEFNYIISSGNTAQTGTSVIQEFDITDTALPPGLYWMAISSSSATSTFFCCSTANDEGSVSVHPCYVQATANPLPTTTATPVIDTAGTTKMLIGMCVSFDTLI